MGQRAFLYVLIFPNGKAYIGMTAKSPDVRMKQHLATARSKRARKQLVHRAMLKHGIPRQLVLMEDTLDEILRQEVSMISLHRTRTPFGYNVDPGGRIRTVSEEERLRMSERAKACGVEHLRAPEVRLRQGLSMKQVWERPGYREAMSTKLSASNSHKPHSEESKQKMSRFQRDRQRNLTDEQRAAAREAGRLAALKRWRKA